MIVVLSGPGPELDECLGRARSLAIIALSSGHGLSSEDRVQLTVEVGRAEEALESLSRSAGFALAADSSYARSLAAPLRATEDLSKATLERIRKDLLLATDSRVTAAGLVSDGLLLEETNAAFQRAAAVVLTDDIEARADDARTALMVETGVAVGGFILALVVAMLVAAGIARPWPRLPQRASAAPRSTPPSSKSSPAK